MTSNYPLIDDLVERVYDVAIAPERMEQLVDAWMERLRGAVDPADFQILVEPGIASHVQRAERVLRELIAVSADAGDAERDWVEASRAAALVVNRSGVVVAANHTAQRSLGVVPGNTLSVLPLATTDIMYLTDLIEHIDRAPEPEVRLLRLRKLDESASILMRIVEAIGGDPGQIGLVTSIMAWPDKLSAQLMATFQLSQAEADVVKHLTLGFSVKEIAERTRRSEATIRTHVSALLQKTGARTQLELVRLALGMLDVVDTPAMITPLRGPPGIVPEPNHYNTLALSDGRTLDYLVIGDPRGRPFLMLPTDMGFTRLPPQAEAWLQHNRMRMIVPVRAGYGHSSPLPLRRDAFDVAIEDMSALSDFLDIERCPLLAFCDDFHLAVSMACKSPERISAIVGVGPVMPANQPKHFQRMPKWTRFIIANARYAPRALPYVTMALFQSIRRLGPKRFIQTVLATSKADLKVLEDNEILTSMLRGTEIAVGPRFTAHVAWAAGAVSNYAVDWSAKLKACSVPMILYAGHQDPFAPFDTTKEFAATNDRIVLRGYADYGQLLYPLWPRFLEDVRQHLSN